MLDKYFLKYDGTKEPVGELTIDFDNDYFDISVNDKYIGPVPSFMKYSDAVLPLSDRIKLWVLERSPERDYEFIDALIRAAGLDAYDSYGFFKYNNGRFITDNFYVVPIVN